MDQSSNCPIPTSKLQDLCASACASALATASSYTHASTQTWNNEIIQAVLQGLIADTSAGADANKYKFIVNSNIIQHLTDSVGGGGEESGSGSVTKGPGRRGMHSASGAYWNNERDGMWSFKYEGGAEKGMDVVVSVMWVGV